mmetsp:Transcript_8128/g.18124  ORF Transcript_8128/g.18124 Transcript_8128/m.18124 type:complete len:341 (+) Transcript_8128:75-1097(+)
MMSRLVVRAQTLHPQQLQLLQQRGLQHPSAAGVARLHWKQCAPGRTFHSLQESAKAALLPSAEKAKTARVLSGLAAVLLGSAVCGQRRRSLSCTSTAAASAPASVSYLDQESAIQVDVDLMSKEGGFSIDQLMELAALSCACSLAAAYPLPKFKKVLLVCGPGNNGGDGLVMARHLRQFGYSPTVVYPKRPKNELYERIVVQLKGLGIDPLSDLPQDGFEGFDVVVDAVFGFSFMGWRGGGKDAPFDTAVQLFASSKVPVLSIDIPSGWNVETGPSSSASWQPDTLVSLTAPKLCAKQFTGRYHFLGGRFVPPWLSEKYSIVLPEYPGAEQCVLLSSAGS